MTLHIDYKLYVNKIIELLLNPTCFNKSCNKIKQEIYNKTGNPGLYKLINMVEDELLNCEYSNAYLGSLRQIELIFIEE